ncbi:MAG TPA: tRNA (N(6)-L-threonylcarbamoyladenosine(37)-C(2))-methylthiotransferase MtaB [Leucothrix mucor]|uniref:tRNA (N(6)-L-threonylcarbamoyladenosine(37)-C(2))-methylthiotransferase MtaB n=1 Tax=Leucothrix mucor TaxID=45248 RepID=A0A7V2T0M5_LEUMU|nr:tRNA (N(6)-L-threonylcarbamoyladenosine(37)-C(2))-methylthiotransferase MtaB [Leucothrix mucor]
MKVHLKALGCRLNEAELEQWSRSFRSSGHELVNEPELADIVVVNTCAVTVDATKKSRKLMNRLHRENPQSKLVVSGCYATLDADKVAERIGVDLVVPNQQKDQLPQQVMDAFAANTMPKIAMEPGESSLFTRGRQRAFIKIQDGCRYRCTFCIVTLARGEERSRSLQEIINEVNLLTEQGIQEIVLTGVHVGGYGSDIGSSLAILVKSLLQETDIPRIRFASVEPWDLPEDFFTLFENTRLMPHMHLPLQSGADSILRRMSRRCKTAEFTRLVEQARIAIPNFNTTSDIIVGFPGETDEEWQQTMQYVESIGFGHLHIFSYSPREGTKAARLANPVDNDIKKQRSRELHIVAAKMKQQVLASQKGLIVDVLWEQEKTNDAGQQIYTGYAPNYLKVETVLNNAISESTSRLKNTITQVQINGFSTETLNLQGIIL